MRSIYILLAALASIMYQSYSIAQVPNYSGTWVLNNEKSKILSKPDGMTGSLFIIKQVQDSFSLTIHHLFGDKRDTIVISMLCDGKVRQVLNILEGKLERKNDGLQITLWKEGFLDIVLYTFGKDENEFIADEVLKSDTDNHHNIWVFDRSVTK